MYKFTKKVIREAIENCNGTQRSLARELRCKSQVTAMKHLNKHEDLTELFNKKQDEIIDFAEDVLMENLKSNNDMVRCRTSEFILKNLPRSRWLENDNSEDVQLELVKLLDKMMDSSE